MTFMIAFLTASVITLVFMLGVLAVSLKIKNNGIVDIAWGLNFILSAFVILMLSRNYSITSLFALTMVLIWGLRLATHIYFRNRGKPEDFRYQAWRKQWGKDVFWQSLKKVYLSQWLVSLPIAFAPAFVIFFSKKGSTFLNMAGIAVWAVGLFWEAVGDWQLAQFKKNPANKGKVMRYGLWKYTRHPNYFGEAKLWWGYMLMALTIPFGWLTIISPLTIDYMLLKVSGIPMLEKKYIGKKEYEDYQKTTSAFFPWKPTK